MLKIERIISVSSEDPAFPAENLLKSDLNKNKKWKCKSAGERSAIVVLQLEKASKIKSIDVGNESSAFIEILVGKSCLPDDNYKVLLVASSLMSLRDAKDSSNTNSVRFFNDTDFCQPEANEQWDRIRIVCSQPYNKHLQFGLSFITLHGDCAQSSSNGNKPGTLGRFALKEDKDNDIPVGSIFARRKELQEEKARASSAAAIRAASSSLSRDDETEDTPRLTKHVTPAKRKTDSDNAVNSNTDKKMKRAAPKPDPSGTPNEKRVKAVNIPNNKESKHVEKVKNATSEKRTATTSSVNIPATPRRVYKPFNELMTGVVFTISGFQNPFRSDIRTKGLAMGAKYRQDWDNTCTHLICAFTNTPKFNQVRGRGKIVKKDWIEDSHSRRVRLPWRRFALVPSESQQPESEEEIYEQTQQNLSDNSSTRRDSTNEPGPSLFGNIPKKKVQRKTANNSPNKLNNSVTDDQDENERNDQIITNKASRNLKNEQTSKNKPSSSSKALDSPAGPSSSLKKVYLDLDLEEVDPDDSVELDDTESDPDCFNTSDEPSLPYLPQQFNDLSFFITDDITPEIKSKLRRYIVAHSGTVLEDCNQDTEYVIVENTSLFNDLKEMFPQIIGVRPEWVWRCHDENRLLSTSNFEL